MVASIEIYVEQQRYRYTTNWQIYFEEAISRDWDNYAMPYIKLYTKGFLRKPISANEKSKYKRKNEIIK